MSTRSTILLSADNEHWYEDFSDYTINLEIESKHVHPIEDGDTHYYIEIKKGSALWRAFYTEIMKYKICTECGCACNNKFSKCHYCENNSFYIGALDSDGIETVE